MGMATTQVIKGENVIIIFRIYLLGGFIATK